MGFLEKRKALAKKWSRIHRPGDDGPCLKPSGQVEELTEVGVWEMRPEEVEHGVGRVFRTLLLKDQKLVLHIWGELHRENDVWFCSNVSGVVVTIAGGNLSARTASTL